MQRVSGFGNVNGRFVAENVAQSLPPTAITAEWLNSQQEELASVVELAGMALDASSNRQVYDAILAIVAQAVGGGVPPGTYVFTAASVAPPGWLVADGSAVSRTAYAALFAAIGTRYGVGDGSTTFNLPDPRGRVLRALDLGKGIDQGRIQGSEQASTLGSHTHSGTTGAGGSHTHPGTSSSVNVLSPIGYGPNFALLAAGNGSHDVYNYELTSHNHSVTLDPGGTHTHNFETAATGGAETRMANLAELCIIKY
jgi:microcystin-dependent protein